MGISKTLGTSCWVARFGPLPLPCQQDGPFPNYCGSVWRGVVLVTLPKGTEQSGGNDGLGKLLEG